MTKAILNILITAGALLLGRIVYQAFGLVGVGALLAGLVIYGHFTRKPTQSPKPKPKQPNPWINK